MKLTLFILFFCLTSYSSFSQNIYNGKIFNKDSKEPVSFANITYNNKGVISDIDGNFSINTNEIIKEIKISYVGYFTKIINISNKSEVLIIYLKKSVNQLNEILINSKNNPANTIIKMVIDNKNLNNPKNIKTFQYISYNKVIFDLLYKKDSLNKNKHAFITETVSKRNYIKPNLTNDVILGTKASGFKNPSFASLATDLQPFSFYNDIVNLYDINYVNPISKGSLKKYKFMLEDELYINNDTVFVISFKPKENKNFDGLKGVLYINSNKYAIQNVEATPAKKMKISLKIQQQYIFLKNKYWFPEQLNYELIFGNEINGIKSSGKSFISNVTFKQNLKKKDFSRISVVFHKDAIKKDNLFWNKYRYIKLKEKDIKTYEFLDSIGEKHRFDDKLLFAESLTDGRYKLKFFDIDLTKFFSFNKFESLRIGGGFFTNNKVFKHMSVGGFFGYGVKDKKWKYGASINSKIPSNSDIKFTLYYQDNLIEIGNNSHSEINFFNSRNLIAFRMNQIKEFGFTSNLKWQRNLSWKVQFKKTKIIPKYSYSFVNDNEIKTKFNNTLVSINMQYMFNEKIVSLFNKKITIPNNYPVLNITYARGFKNLFKSHFKYNTYNFRVNHSFNTKNFGTTKYQLNAGYIDTDLPYNLLFTGEGGLDNELPVLINNHFQTSEPYEFLSDSYLNLFTSQNFGGLLFKTNKFQPDIILHNNFGIGYLSNKNTHNEISFKTKENIFLETGLEFRNLLKLNYLNMGSIGFGFATFYRYGFYSLPKTNGNIKYKFVMSYTLK